MTDARFPDRWLSDRRLQRLSDSHFRAFITSLAWSVSNRTDGVIEPDDLALIPNFPLATVKPLIEAELWLPQRSGWLIADYAVTQTTSAQLIANEQQRVREREKKARQRAAKRSAATCGDAAVPGDRPGDVPGDNPGEDRTGKDRPVVENPQLAAVANGSTVWRGTGPSPFEEYK